MRSPATREDIADGTPSDPAARTSFEIWLTYSGLHAIWGYRLAHWLWTHGAKTLARAVSQFVRSLTGVEIHPGRDHRSAILHRSRHGRGDRRDNDHRRRRAALPRRHPRRHEARSRRSGTPPSVMMSSWARVRACSATITIGAHTVIGANSVVLHDAPGKLGTRGFAGRGAAAGTTRDRLVLGFRDLSHLIS